jgi:hypothetical protein
VPSPRTGYDQRWIDNADGMVIARDSRFGGEGGGFTVVNNMASFLRVPGRVPGGPGGSGHNRPPPPRGPLPPGTDWVLNPQNAAVIISGCQVDSLGNKERAANVYLEQLPAILVVERSQGFGYAPKWLSANFSFLKVDPRLDLDGPQLDFAGRHPHMLRIDIDSTNTWGPAGYFWSLPQQLWPYLQVGINPIDTLVTQLLNMILYLV